jgi:hypothetical protein
MPSMRTCSYYFRKRVLPLALSRRRNERASKLTHVPKGSRMGGIGVSNVELHNVAGVGGFYPVFIGSCIEC